MFRIDSARSTRIGTKKKAQIRMGQEVPTHL